MNKKVSIVMPMYGVEKYIGKAIESVLNQSYSNWELLIVNDGSTDRSRSIAETYAQKDSRIFILDKINGGLSDARNYGLRYATGDYIHFFDSDDYVDPDFYDSFLQNASIECSSVIISGYTVEYNVSKSVRPSFNHIFDLTEDCEFVDVKEDVVCLYLNYAWNKIYHRAFLLENGLEFEKGLSRIEDAEFFSRVIKYAKRLCFIQYAGYHYVQRSEITLSRYVDSTLFLHYVRSFGLYASVIDHLHFSSHLKEDAYAKFIIDSTKAFLNRLYLEFPKNGLFFYWSFTNQMIVYLRDNEIYHLSQDKTLFGYFIKFSSRKHFSFILFLTYILRSLVRK